MSEYTPTPEQMAGYRKYLKLRKKLVQQVLDEYEQKKVARKLAKSKKKK
jgi:hypothetical protein